MIAGIGLALSKFGSWVANNRAVQWVLGVLLFIFGLIMWGERREGQGRKAEKIKARERDVALKERADEGAKEIIQKEKTNADAAQDAGELAMRAEPNPVELMSELEFRFTYGRSRQAGDPGFRGEG